MLHVAFLRSQHAHARLTSVDASAARGRPGVVAVYTAADLGDYWRPGPLLVPPPPIAGLVFNPCTQVPLAKDKVRHVGEAVAMVVAESRYLAEDALDDIVVEAEPLPAVVDLEAALAPGTPRVHEHLPSNLAAHAVQRKGDYARAKARAHAIIKRRFRYDRGASAAVEERAVAAHWDARGEELTVWDTTQAPIPIRNGLAQLLGLLESQVRVVAPYVGGGFGPKIMMFYPEEVLVPWAAMRLGRPVKWTEDRQENFFATTQERGQIHDAELAVAKDGTILGVKDVFLHDTGAYEPALDAALKAIDYGRFVREEQPRLRAAGRHVGIGVVCYVEGTGIGPYEGARVTVEPSGRVRLATGVGTQGQGHFTVFAQIVAEVLGVDAGEVHVVTGDTREFHWGTGTFASRGAVVAGSACHAAAVAVRAKVLDLASRELEAAAADLVLDGGRVHVRGDPGGGLALGALALKANPLRGAVRPGTEPGLEATAYFGPDRGSTANGVHAMVVEVDPETAQVEIKRYVVVHDCGRVINPMIVEGQIHGGVAHGIGNAFYEQLVYDEEGQLLNASFMDYLLPTATDVPNVETTHRETRSPLNPVGTKGVGEAGAIPTGALFAQAVEDALAGSGLEICEMPLSPNRLFELMSASSPGVKP